MSDILPLLRTHGSILHTPEGCLILQDLFRRVNICVAEINALSDATEIIRKRQAQIYRLALISSALAPIRKLPIEVLSEIFMVYHDSCDGSETISPFRLFTQVCWTWRSTAQSTARLWTKLVWKPSATGVVEYSGLVRQWCEYGRAMPMELTIRDANFGVHFVKACPRELETILAPILPFVHRCSTLNLSLPLPSLIPLFTLDKPSLPNLEYLVIEITDGCLPLDFSVTTFCNSPCLRKVVLRSDFEPAFDLLKLLRLPTSLTHLDIQKGVSPSVCSLWNIISSCSNLRTAFFYVPLEEPSTDQVSSPLTSSRVTLPYLYLLSLEFPTPRTVIPLLERLVLPSLSELYLSQSSAFSPFYALGQCLLDLQAQSAFELKCLHMQSVHSISCEELLMFLRGSNNTILEIDLDRCLGIDVKAFADALSYTEGAQANILPKLKVLRMVSLVDRETDVGNIWTAVKTRWKDEDSSVLSELLDEEPFKLKEVHIVLHDLVKGRHVHLCLPPSKRGS